MPRRASLPALLLAALAVQAAPAPAQVAAPDAAETPRAEAPALPAISVVTVARRALSDRIRAAGLVQPVEQVQVQPLIEGQPIDSLMVDVGDRVEAGQPLARLSGATLDLQRSQYVASRAAAVASIAQAEAQRVEAQASALEAQRVLRRTQALRDQGTTAQAALDQAQASADAANARVTAAEEGLRAAQAQRDLVDAQIADVDLRLQRTLVAAPVAGIVTERTAQVGAVATAQGEPMFTLIRDGALELRADVAEQDIGRLAPGQAVSLHPAGVAEPLTGTVRLVEPTVDATTRLGRVRIGIDATDRIRAGQFAEAEILVERREALALPAAAIARGGSATGAAGAEAKRVRADGTVEVAPVTLGIRDGAWVEIREGLFAGDRVVARAGAFVRPGDRINPVDAADTPDTPAAGN
ncbi:efflux RND transporter periplasmic adaptor subunit [Frigidibacter sp. MR17.24]|uniref:efflux RND transporter periplasmic adaptor subunit n=1 Tax=Frigidibacter sp. MR17.24 TaxID=3127345 RepID=UPI003012C67B